MKKFAFLCIVFFAQYCFAQREYHFNYLSVYEITQTTPPQPAKEVKVYDHSEDTAYQMILYPDAARIHDDARNEIHYFKTEVVADTLRYQYEYSLKVLFSNDVEITNVQLKKRSDRDYELTYVKKSPKNQTREKMEFCLMESEEDLLNITFNENGKKESNLLLNRLRKSLDRSLNYRVEEALHTAGRYKTQYRRTALHPVELTVTLPAAIHYKNSFLKN